METNVEVVEPAYLLEEELNLEEEGVELGEEEPELNLDGCEFSNSDVDNPDLFCEKLAANVEDEVNTWLGNQEAIEQVGKGLHHNEDVIQQT